MNELQTVELDILKKFSEAANSEGLNWYAMFGTLLGAVRHCGFIPWDDDIDIAMPRADYDRLRGLTHLFNEPYFLQTTTNDPEAAPHFIRLRRSDTAVISRYPNGLIRGGNLGAYIDIIPLDDMPDRETARKIQKAVHRIQNQMYACAALDESDGKKFPEHKEIFCHREGGIAGYYNFFAERYESFCSRYSDEPYYAFPVLSGERGNRVYDKEWFTQSSEAEFEGLKIPVPIGWREVLVACFPEGLYEPLPKHRKRRFTEHDVIDTKRSYKEYMRRYTDMLSGIDGKKVFLFGAGESLEIWLRQYGKGLNVICTFDNSELKWGTAAHGVLVRPPKELPGLIDENSKLIITSIFHKEIAEQIECMGITDYSIFIDGLSYAK